MERDKGGAPGSNRGRKCTEAGEEGAGDGITKKKNTQGQEPLKKGAGTGSTRYGKQEIQTPLSPHA